jgi:hypothetical protein
MGMLVKAQTSHISKISCECCAYQEQHLPHIAAEPSLIQLLETCGDQRCIVLGRNIFVFPCIVSFQYIEVRGCGLPFAVGLGL